MPKKSQEKELKEASQSESGQSGTEKRAIEKLVPDTSVIIDGLVSKQLQNKNLNIKSVLIHEAVLAELEHQANMNRATGHLGIDEIEKVKLLAKEKKIELLFGGRRPSAAEIRHASLGEIDAMIRELAYEESATLFTADKIQVRLAKTKSMDLVFVDVEKAQKSIKLESFFDTSTMSVHLRENVEPFAKKGMPGSWKFVSVRTKKLTRDEIQDISRETIEEANFRKDGFIEIERPGSTIIQLSNFRIVITRPPFSDGWEITAVRPVKRLSIEDYQLSENLMKRILEKAEGILIAGSPGMGKSTFAQALAELYMKQNKIIKTVEAPRDLVLPENITQYAISHGDAQEIHDILLLSRPDYTIYDEMRNTNDFKLFADLRLSGIGLTGVVHATSPIDAIQRFVGRIELGVIPQVIDTVIFIKDGMVAKVLSLNMTVKVPSGMTEADLARPVVVVNDFETKKLEYELYSYGEETVVIPVRSAESKPASHALAEQQIEKEMLRYADNVKVDVTSGSGCTVYVPEESIAGIIGKSGSNIGQIEKKLGIHIDVQELKKDQDRHEMDDKEKGVPVEYETQISKKNIVFHLNIKYKNKDIDIYVGSDYLLTAKAGKSGIIKISKKNKIGKMLADAIMAGDDVVLEAK